jgi:hypothetical protein
MSTRGSNLAGDCEKWREVAYLGEYCIACGESVALCMRLILGAAIDERRIRLSKSIEQRIKPKSMHHLIDNESLQNHPSIVGKLHAAPTSS